MSNNIFLDLLYKKEFVNITLLDKIKNYFHYKSFLYRLKDQTPTFEVMWDFAKYLRFVDIIYGFDEEMNSDIDLIKKRNPYLIDSSTKQEIEISFTIRSDNRSTFYFQLDKEGKFIHIEVKREKTRFSEDKLSQITFQAGELQYQFSDEDRLLICEINRILQDKMIRYTKLYYERIK